MTSLRTGAVPGGAAQQSLRSGGKAGDKVHDDSK
jgi:hypothetical protein